jgi:hypothetical protein
MQKLLTIISAMLVSSTILTSCGGNNTTTEENKKTVEKEGKAEGKVEGKLEGKFVLKSSEDSYMIFNSDGTGEEKSSTTGLEKFEWKINEGELCISKKYQMDEASEPLSSSSCGKYTLKNNELNWEVDGFNIQLYKPE